MVRTDCTSTNYERYAENCLAALPAQRAKTCPSAAWTRWHLGIHSPWCIGHWCVTWKQGKRREEGKSLTACHLFIGEIKSDRPYAINKTSWAPVYRIPRLPNLRHPKHARLLHFLGLLLFLHLSRAYTNTCFLALVVPLFESVSALCIASASLRFYSGCFLMSTFGWTQS